MAVARKDDDTPPPALRKANPGRYHWLGNKPRGKMMREEDAEPESGRNGTGRTDLGKVKDDEIARLRAQLADRGSDPSIASTVKHWRRMFGAVAGVVALCSSLFAGLAWYTSSTVSAAMAAERLATQERIETSTRMQISSAHFAPMETVAVQQQKLTDIDRRLDGIEGKLDIIISRLPRR